MSDDELALLRGAATNPDEDLPRLVYADWLDDHGRHDQAAFVRLQVRRSRLDFFDPERLNLLEEERISQQLFGRKWNGPIHRWLFANGLRDRIDARRAPIRGWKFHRGLPGNVTVTGAIPEGAFATVASLGTMSVLWVFQWEGWIGGQRAYPASLQAIRLAGGLGSDLPHSGTAPHPIAQVPLLDLRRVLIGNHAPRLGELARLQRLSPVILFRSWAMNTGSRDRIIDPFNKWPAIQLWYADVTGELSDPLPYQSTTR